MCVRVYMYISPNKEKFSTDLKNSFFVRKVWTRRVSWATYDYVKPFS